MSNDVELCSAIYEAIDQRGRSIAELCDDAPLMVVFLRHSGCTFCRQAVADLAGDRKSIEAAGVRIALVHQDTDEGAAAFFGRYGLADVSRISDPSLRLYQAAGLAKGTLKDVLHPLTLAKGFQACILGGHGAGAINGDVFQMPGVLLLHRRRVVRSHRAQSPADRPDLLGMTRIAARS